jgi:two-component system sensor histidine kinase RegB
MTFDLEPAVTLVWLVRLRWSFLVGQLCALPMFVWFGMPLSPVLIAVEVAVMAASNVALLRLRGDRRWSTAGLIGAVMVLDTGLWTLLLAGAGGSANPFTVVYLVHIAISALVLRPLWTGGIAVLSLAGFGVLFAATPAGAMMHHDEQGFARHLQAMWAAFALAAALIAFFVGRVTREIASQREQIARLRETTAHHARHASVMRLAAGAAHELGSPLATIAVAAHEAKLHLAMPDRHDAVVADLDLVALEIERCHAILKRMSTRSRDPEDDVTLALRELADAIRDRLGEQCAQRVDLHVESPDVTIRQPAESLAESLVALINNAVEASADDHRVVVVLSGNDRRAEITIQDRGDGISEPVLARIGTPFFTTKQEGRGLGLGVFLARAFFESRGGELALESTPGVGTRAVVHVPLGVTT